MKKRHLARLLELLIEARVVILVLYHAFLFGACYVFATFARFDFNLGSPRQEQLFASALPVVVAVELLFGTIFGFYRGWWRYVGISDVMRTVAGTTAATGVLFATWYVDPSLTGVSRAVLLINWAFINIALFATRVVVRLTQDYSRVGGRGQKKRVLIIGAGDAGEALAREIQNRPQLEMKVVGFVDDKSTKWGSHIRGIQVQGPIASIARIAERLRAGEVLIAIPSASGKRLREIVHLLHEADLQSKTIPGLDQLVTGKVHATQLRPVNIEDLIRREKIDLPGDPLRELFRGKRVLVTGAGGTIGCELATQILDFEPEHVALVERSEFALYEARRRLGREHGTMISRVSSNLVDVRDAQALRAVLAQRKPQIILHAAAHKHVPLGEENPPEYVRNNCLATRALAEMSDAMGVERFVLISTDKAINPTSVMGASKRAAEIVLLDFAKRSRMKITAVRFGNVLGSSGSAVPLFLEQIANGGPVTVTHPDVTRYFLRTSEAISLVLQAATLSDGGKVFMLDMGEPVKIAELARDLIHLSHHTEDEIPIEFTGLRPGEKLFEEVRLDGESSHPTVHPQIVVTEAPQPPTSLVADWLSRAPAQLDAGPDAAILALRELIPEYAPPRSVVVPAAAATPKLPIHKERHERRIGLTPAAETVTP